MTKSTITRERLEELAAGQSGFNLRIATHEESQELARMALVAMESEPVAYSLIFRNMGGALKNHINTNTVFATREKAEGYGKGGNYEERSDGGLEWVPNAALDPVVIPLYRHAQPAPVVGYVTLGDSPYDIPYSMPSNLREFIDQEIGILFSDDDAQGVWIACRRAAMLNGGKS